MGRDSGIEWTEHTFNPWWGCQKVSPGCEHCYADTFSSRFHDNLWGPPAYTDRRLFGDSHWAEPIRWNAAAERDGTPARVFCASMADVFEDAPQVETARERLWHLIDQTPWLVWLLLTKRPENINGMAPAAWRHGWPDNVWMGTSAEDQKRADERIAPLLDVPARRHFLSAEPLLGPLNIASWLHDSDCWTSEPRDVCWCDERDVRERHISWVIVGGESGPRARPMDPRWVRSLRDQCTDSTAAFFFKQWGAWAPSMGRSSDQILMWPDGTHRPDVGPPHTPPGWTNLERVGKRDAGRELDGTTWSQVPPLREVAHG